MSRPKNYRHVSALPKYKVFKRPKIPLNQHEKEYVTVEEFEALRLIKYETKLDGKRLTQTECADRMNVSQPTFSRILDSALVKITRALVEGKALIIKGGKFGVVKPALKEAFHGYGCLQCDNEWKVEKKQHSKQCPECDTSQIYTLIRK